MYATPFMTMRESTLERGNHWSNYDTGRVYVIMISVYWWWSGSFMQSVGHTVAI